MTLSELIEQAQLPSSIDVIVKLQQSIATGIESASDFAIKLETDAGLTARVLRLANSAFYGRRSIENVEAAVVLIGEDDLVSMVISTEIINAFKNANQHVDMQVFWQENIFTAISAKIIARRVGRDKARLFTAALLRKVGQLVLYKAQAEKMLALMSQHINEPESNLLDLEQQGFGFTHPQLGAELLIHWKIPETVTTPIQFYLNPSDTPPDSVIDAAIIYLAHRHTHHKFELPTPNEVDNNWLNTTLGITTDALLAEAGEEIQAHYDRTVAMLLN